MPLFPPIPSQFPPIPPSSYRALRFYADTSYDCDVRAWCKLHSITYQSFWTLTANPHVLNNKAVQDAAKAAGVTPEQVMRMGRKGGGGGLHAAASCI